MTILIITLVVIANILGSAMAYPQAAKLLRTGNPEGVSAIWAGVSVSMNLWWLVYGIANSLWGLVPTSAIATALYAVIVVAFVRSVGRSAFGGLAFGALVFGLVPLPVLLVAGWSAAGVTIGLCYGMQLFPAVVAAFRTTDLSGVAAGTWIMAWIEGAIWGAYGLFVVDGALLIGGVAGVLMASLMLARLTMTGHRPLDLRRASLVSA
ncbi:hypothetical protein [Ilumatobacter coccineus]|jgi:uncharacterized protein with PQ loop repeat|uniref:Uncharacterized protein n=1 Tax=Ilumatobacter coccineus (strain NBRC 103263 / KCTC 29153 / YM16-304) TaxID=1313172 RepID=A0A6C7E589_ILUCY|nr:hypothetical protein [Ilumatobacter coccineus]BAN00425.1 hypothetical protein YM304_01110 [Ilumatobacter coccineus YM16-304]